MSQKVKLILRRFFIYWGPVILWSFAIFIVSNRTVPKSSEFFWQDFVVKKLAHIFEYAVLSTLFYRALLNEGLGKKNAGIWAIILTALYGASDEYHQSFIPGRQSTIRDIVIDSFGAGLAVSLIWTYLPRTTKRIQYLLEKLGLSSK
jgi:hypothetical protein